MYSICIKFKQESGWRPQCRQAATVDEIMDLIGQAFEKWPVKHVSLFDNGVYCRTFFMPPFDVRKAMQSARQRSAAQIRYGYF